jgi:hypothetical protein
MRVPVSPTVGIERNLVVYEQVVELKAVSLLKYPFEKFPRYFELNGMFEKVGHLLATGDQVSVSCPFTVSREMAASPRSIIRR